MMSVHVVCQLERVTPCEVPDEEVFFRLMMTAAEVYKGGGGPPADMMDLILKFLVLAKIDARKINRTNEQTIGYEFSFDGQ
jgi:hypothetical protein